MAPQRSADHLINGQRSALLHRLIPAADRLPSVGGSLRTWGVGVEEALPDVARSQDMGKVVHALRQRTAGSPTKRRLQPGVFTPRLSALLSAPSAASMGSQATTTDGAAARPGLTASASAAGRMCHPSGGSRAELRSLRTSSSMGVLASGANASFYAAGSEAAGSAPALALGTATPSSAGPAASQVSQFPAGASVRELQALQREQEALAAAVAAARPHAASLALRWLEGSATPLAIEAFLGSHPLFRRLGAAQVRRLACDARFVRGARYGTVYREGAPVDRPAEMGGGVGIVLQGTALLHTPAVGGVHRRVGVAEWVGEGCLVSARLPRLHSCEWLTTGLVLMMPLAAVEAAVQVRAPAGGCAPIPLPPTSRHKPVPLALLLHNKHTPPLFLIPFFNLPTHHSFPYTNTHTSPRPSRLQLSFLRTRTCKGLLESLAGLNTGGWGCTHSSSPLRQSRNNRLMPLTRPVLPSQ